MCLADLWEHHLLGLPDDQWRKYAEGVGVLTPDVVIQDDGTAVSNDPDLSAFLADFEKKYREGKGG